MNSGFLNSQEGPSGTIGTRANPRLSPSSPTIARPTYLLEGPQQAITTNDPSTTPFAWGSGSPVLLGINAYGQTSGNAIEIAQAGTSRFSVAWNGATAVNSLTGNNVSTGSTGYFAWGNRSKVYSTADGIVELNNAAASGFTRLNFGGATSSFPSIGRSTTTLTVQLADGTAGGTLATSLPLAKVGGCLEEFFTDAVTPASTTETDLYSFTTIANTFANNGDKIIARYGGTYSSNATSVEIKVYFGGNQIFTTGLHGMATTEHWDIDVLLIRVSSGTVRCITKWLWSASSVSEVTYSEVTGLTLSNTNILKITGQSNTGPASGDITARLGYINWYPVG